MNPADEIARMKPGTGELRKRVVSALVLAAVVLVALLIGGWIFALLWLVAAIVGLSEWLTMSRSEPARTLMIASAGFLGLLALASEAAAAGAALALIGLIGAIALVVLARGGPARLNALLGFICATVIALVPPVLRDDPGIGILGPAWMFAIVWSSDIAAYFTGRRFGGPKLLPRVSPKKTWSGALGGLAAATFAGLGLAGLAHRQGWVAPTAWSPAGIALASAAASVVSQAGDLLESALKRRYGVKDSGHSIPGHGGVMDRLDGFFAVALLVGLWLLAQTLLEG